MPFGFNTILRTSCSLSLPPLVVYGLLLAVFFCALWQLPSLELQPYDEGYYALRAKAILHFGCWLNQADYAIGGFYSASHPPLHIWLMVLSAKIFGLSEFALRLPSLIMLVLFLLTLVFCASRSSLPCASLCALIVCGFLPLLLWYGRLAHLDSTLIVFSLLQVHFYLRYTDTNRLTFAALAGVMLGGALLSKVLVGMFPALALTLFELYRLLMRYTSLKKATLALAVFYAIGLTVGLSWFVWMCRTHGEYLQQYVELFLTDRIARNQTLSEYRTGVFYYLNVVLTRFPLSTLSVMWLWRFSHQAAFREPYRVLWLLWAALTFLLLSLAQTKLLWYALLFLPPLALITAESLALLLDALQDAPLSRSAQVSLMVLLYASAWSLLQPLHREVLDALLTRDVALIGQWLGLLCGLGGAGVFGLWLLRRMASRAATLLALILAVSTGAALQTVFHGLPFVQLYAGAKIVGDYLQQHAPVQLIHLVSQKRVVEKSFNPQFSYYLNGVDVNAERWGVQMNYVYLPVSDTLGLRQALSLPGRALVVVEKTARAGRRLTIELFDEFAPLAKQMNMHAVLDTPNYVVYETSTASADTAQFDLPPSACVKALSAVSATQDSFNAADAQRKSHP
jgi:4-amino-4-deoxy-L-arabinose transferase-like glycosyltransferase